MIVKIKGIIENTKIVDIYYNKILGAYEYYYPEEWQNKKSTLSLKFKTEQDALNYIYSIFHINYDKVVFPKFTKKELKKYGVKDVRNCLYINQ